MSRLSIGYTGQRRSSVSGNYLLGNGYRGFNPVLKRFAGQDSMSPFEVGGTHGYSYCGGDSINQTDSSGRGPIIDLIMLVDVGAVRGTKRAAEADITGKIVEDAVADIAGVTAERRTGPLKIYSSALFSMSEDDARSMAESFIDNYVRKAGYKIQSKTHTRSGRPVTRKLINVKGKLKGYYAKPRFNKHGNLYKLDIYSEDDVRLTKKLTPDLAQYMEDFENDAGLIITQKTMMELRATARLQARPLPSPELQQNGANLNERIRLAEAMSSLNESTNA